MPVSALDIELLEYDITGSQAHAKMLVETGIISPEEGEALVKRVGDDSSRVSSGGVLRRG